jgi:DNA invertase Pin-like site-specific DNA recombinase
MISRNGKAVRCAIYTRVSTDAGLDQDFNSLDAQFEGASAYIRSQAHAGWTHIRKRYDDGGFSGGSTDRPALQQLLTDVREGRINVIVVYKVDRLTRSLADFAKLVELFDQHGVSFVSVTQQFNTTTSMGRLTLNVLLSFAQFEREVTSERIRDKIAASKRRGLWVGGVVPLGYEAKSRKITVVESEAGTVRYIFKRYLKLGSISALLTDLKKADIRTKRRTLSTGKIIGGIPFGRGALGYLLRNRFYIGEVKYKGEILWGEQKPIFDRKLFDAVQSKLDAQCNDKKTARVTSGALLMGRIFDDRGNRMTPTSKLKKGVRYRYYISTALVQGQRAEAGTVSRAPAELIEKLVTDAVRKQLQQPGSATKAGREGHANSDARSIIREHVERVEILPTTLKVQLSTQAQADKCKSTIEKPVRLTIPWTKPSSKVAREIIPPLERSQRIDKRPIRAETRAKLILAIAQGRRWVGELIDGVVTSIQEIATREGCSLRQVNRAMTLAFLSPRLVEAAIWGKLPRGIGAASVYQLPTEWSRQHAALGLKL